MARQSPKDWKGPRLALRRTLVSIEDAAVIGDAGGIALDALVEAQFWVEDGSQQETRTVTSLEFLQGRLNSLAQHYEFDRSQQTAPTHRQTVEALHDIWKTARKLREKLGLPTGLNFDNAWNVIPAAIYHELTIPARHLAAEADPNKTVPLYTADMVLGHAVASFLSFEELLKNAYEGARLFKSVTNDETGADAALNSLILHLGDLYRIVARRSAGIGRRRADGNADSPFVRFSYRACKVLKIKKITPDGVASRFKRARDERARFKGCMAKRAK